MRRVLVMLSVLVPIVAVFATAIGFGLVYGRDQLSVYNDYTGSTDWAWRVWVVVLPGTLLAAWAAFEVVCLIRRRPPRLLDARVKAPIRRVIAGSLVGVLSLCASIILAAYFDNRVPDAVLLGGGTFIACFAAAMCWRRVKPLHCPACNYDLRDSLSPTMRKCPECGMDAA